MRIIAVFWALGCLIGASKPTGEYCNQSFLGRHGSGILRSHNFPFDYLHNLTCTYRIHLDHAASTDSGPKSICFSFHRFSLENSTLFCSFDYLKFDNIKYCGAGLWQYGVLGNAESNVWYPNFCWPVKNNYFDIHFNSDNSVNGRGFYATYTILDGALPRQRPPAAIPGQAPCPESKWTCFNRRCIPLSLVCDGHDDCRDGSDESYMHARCGEQNIFACDFSTQGGLSDGFCGFTQQGGDWFRTNTRTSPSGPSGDHTNSTIGYYVYTDTDHSPAYLVSPEITLPQNQTYCLSFWYYVYGDPAAAMLKVYVERQQTYSRPEWNRVLGDTGRWQLGEVSIHIRGPLQVVFGAEFENRFSGVALDDLALLPGPCSGNDISCNFESSMCGWSPVTSVGSVYGNHSWQIQKRVHAAMGPLEDHSSADGSGAYLFVTSPVRSLTESRALIMSGAVSSFPGKAMCLRLAYYMAGAGDDCCILRARLHYSNATLGHALWSQNGRRRNAWREVGLHLDVAGPFEVVLEGVVSPGGRGQIAVDHIWLDSAGCPTIDAGTCDVGEYLCSDGWCITASQKCDGKLDCEDGSDEDWRAGCQSSTTTTQMLTSTQCPSSYYHCHSNGKCIPPGWLCDSFTDCEDGSDENELAGCSGQEVSKKESCEEDEHMCDNGACLEIIKVTFCDGHPDCPDGSDEGDRGNCTGARDIGPNEICKVSHCSDGEGVLFLGAGIIAGIVLGCIIFIILVVIGTLLLMRKFRKHRRQDQSAITYATDVSTISYGDDSSVHRPMEIVEDSSLERPIERAFARNSRGSRSAPTTEHRSSYHRASHHRDFRDPRDARDHRQFLREPQGREPFPRSSHYRGSAHSLHRDSVHRDPLHRGSLHRNSQHHEPGDSMQRVDSWVSRDSFHRIPQEHRESYIRRGSQDLLISNALRNSCPQLDQPEELHISPGTLEDLRHTVLPVHPPPYTPQDTLGRSHQIMGYIPNTQQTPALQDVFLPPDEPPPPYDSALKDAVVLSAVGSYRSHLMQSSV